MVTGWFVKLVAVLAVIGVIAFDGFSIVAAHLSASDDAQTAAQAAANAYATQKTPAAALLAAEQALHKGDTLVPNSMTISSTGEVTIKLQRTAGSIILHHFSAGKKWDIVTEGGTADPPS